MFEDELFFLKKYLEDNRYKRFICANTSSFNSQVLFVKRFGRKLRFCVNNKKLFDLLDLKNSQPIEPSLLNFEV